MMQLRTIDALPAAAAPAGNGATPGYTAIIDIGSGSARAVIMQVNPGGGIEVVAQQQVSLNLMSHVNADGILDAAGVAATLDALDDFALLAQGYGIRAIHAVGTAALRESGNAAAITSAAARRFGIPLRIIDGGDEAAYCFIGAIHGLPVSDGILADIGGGSTEIVHFADRAMQTAVSLPVGSLRLANRFGLTDRPDADDLQAAGDYVRQVLADAGVPRLADGALSDSDGGVLTGSGGSVRLLARLARAREEIYPVVRMHGYEIGAAELDALTGTLAGLSRRQRAGMVGMNPQRVHSIVGGAVIARALAQHTAAAGILVSGQGLREGLARHPHPLPSAGSDGRSDGSAGIRLPGRAAVRRAALDNLARRFAPRYTDRGPRRAALAGRIAAAAWHAYGRPDDGCYETLAGALASAAFLLDIGDAIDFYNRRNRAASIIVRTDLPGYTHRETALMAAILLVSERGQAPRRFRQSRLLSAADAGRLAQAAAILDLADALDRRLPPEMPAPMVQVRRESGTFMVRTPGWSDAAASEPAVAAWPPAFGEPVSIAATSTATTAAAPTASTIATAIPTESEPASEPEPATNTAGGEG